MTDIRERIIYQIVSHFTWNKSLAEWFVDNKILPLFKDYRNINEPIMKKCDECGGRGIKRRRYTTRFKPQPCSTCKGKGEVPEMVEVECPGCEGMGRLQRHHKGGFNCIKCKGTGKIKRPKTLKDLIEEERK